MDTENMVKRITVSIPDELHKKMQGWRNEIKSSHEFQKAISSLISKKERQKAVMTDGVDINAAIERLREEKKMVTLEYFDKGEAEGYQWAACADFKELKQALYLIPYNEMIKKNKNPSNGIKDHTILSHDPTELELIGDYFHEVLANDKNLALEYKGEDENFGIQLFLPNDLFANWEEGWVKGVKKFWNEVKDKI